MNLLFSAIPALLVMTLWGCSSSSSAPPDPAIRADEATSAQAKPPVSAPTVAATPTAVTPATPTQDKIAPASTTAVVQRPVESSKPVVSAKPVESSPPVRTGACTADADCGGGQVCETCAGGKCCTPGCHTNAQCPSGKRCQKVQCVRAPCPGICE